MDKELEDLKSKLDGVSNIDKKWDGTTDAMKYFAGILIKLSTRVETLTNWLIGFTIGLFILTGVLVWLTIILLQKDWDDFIEAETAP